MPRLVERGGAPLDVSLSWGGGGRWEPHRYPSAHWFSRKPNCRKREVRSVVRAPFLGPWGSVGARECTCAPATEARSAGPPTPEEEEEEEEGRETSGSNSGVRERGGGFFWWAELRPLFDPTWNCDKRHRPTDLTSYDGARAREERPCTRPGGDRPALFPPPSWFSVGWNRTGDHERALSFWKRGFVDKVWGIWRIRN